MSINDSASTEVASQARQWLGNSPEMVFIDSSHAYEHTRRELDLWFDEIMPGGLIALHDVSIQAVAYDGTGQGGVRRAFQEWTAERRVPSFALNGGVDADRHGLDDIVYGDGCGLGLIQRPFTT